MFMLSIQSFSTFTASVSHFNTNTTDTKMKTNEKKNVYDHDQNVYISKE